jgi:hypothetical protein
VLHRMLSGLMSKWRKPRSCNILICYVINIPIIAAHSIDISSSNSHKLLPWTLIT